MYANSRRRLLAATAIAFLSVSVAACGNSDSNGDKSKSSTTSAGDTTAAGPTEATGGSIGRTFTADPSIVSPHPIVFDSWTRVAPDKISVNFQTGSPECYGVDATTTETDSTVTVELRGGTLPSAVGKMCTMIAVFGSLEIPLKAPLGDRKVVSAN
ncbi:hypothetical protein [Nocardia jejuensis]|uniref:hypothetical protein n=1 Tax=Nocardia jejuensis TaxID=328049 RepID=UPI00082A97C7|nr:hypothetical protein [Nocardia jejuensis]